MIKMYFRILWWINCFDKCNASLLNKHYTKSVHWTFLNGSVCLWNNTVRSKLQPLNKKIRLFQNSDTEYKMIISAGNRIDEKWDTETASSTPFQQWPSLWSCLSIWGTSVISHQRRWQNALKLMQHGYWSWGVRQHSVIRARRVWAKYCELPTQYSK